MTQDFHFRNKLNFVASRSFEQCPYPEALNARGRGFTIGKFSTGLNKSTTRPS